MAHHSAPRTSSARLASSTLLIALVGLCIAASVTIAAAAPVPAAAHSCDGAQHSGPVAVTIDPADPPAGPAVHDGCEYAQSLTFAASTSSVGALVGVAFRITQTTVAGALTFAASLRLGAGCSIAINGSRLFGGLALDAAVVAAMPIDLSDTVLDGLFFIAPSAALPCGANVTVRRSALMGVELAMHRGGLDIDGSNTFDPGYGGRARDNIAVTFATIDDGDACEPPVHTLVFRGVPGAASVPRMAACATARQCVFTYVTIAALPAPGTKGKRVLRRARIVIEGIGVVGRIDVDADAMENCSVAVRGVSTFSASKVSLSASTVSSSDFAVDGAWRATDLAVLDAFGSWDSRGTAYVEVSCHYLVSSSLLVANASGVDVTVFFYACDRCAVAIARLRSFKSISIWIEEAFYDASIAVRNVSGTAFISYVGVRIVASMVRSTVCFRDIDADYIGVDLYPARVMWPDEPVVSNGSSSVAFGNLTASSAAITVANPADISSATLIGADVQQLDIEFRANTPTALLIRDVRAGSEMNVLQSGPAAYGLNVTVADVVASVLHFLFEPMNFQSAQPHVGPSYVLANITLSESFLFGHYFAASPGDTPEKLLCQRCHTICWYPGGPARRARSRHRRPPDVARQHLRRHC